MKKQLTHIVKGATSLMVGLVLMMFFQSNLSFKHAHYLSDGTTVEHAHPFSDNNGNQHKHNKSEISFLSLLNPNSDLFQDFPNLNIKANEIFVESCTEIEEPIQLMEFPLNLLRGPPVC